MDIIRVRRAPGQDASQAASAAAREAGTTLAGNLRWQGKGIIYRSAPTADGREVRVEEIERERCGQCGSLTADFEAVPDERAGTVTLLCPACRA